jgi:hypothetical protein
MRFVVIVDFDGRDEDHTTVGVDHANERGLSITIILGRIRTPRILASTRVVAVVPRALALGIPVSWTARSAKHVPFNQFGDLKFIAQKLVVILFLTRGERLGDPLFRKLHDLLALILSLLHLSLEFRALEGSPHLSTAIIVGGYLILIAITRRRCWRYVAALATTPSLPLPCGGILTTSHPTAACRASRARSLCEISSLTWLSSAPNRSRATLSSWASRSTWTSWETKLLPHAFALPHHHIALGLLHLIHDLLGRLVLRGRQVDRLGGFRHQDAKWPQNLEVDLLQPFLLRGSQNLIQCRLGLLPHLCEHLTHLFTIRAPTATILTALIITHRFEHLPHLLAILFRYFLQLLLLFIRQFQLVLERLIRHHHVRDRTATSRTATHHHESATPAPSAGTLFAVVRIPTDRAHHLGDEAHPQTLDP